MLHLLKFYSKKLIQKEIVRSAKAKEIAVRFGDRGFGKRPDILQFENDVLELVKQGVTSFHVSEETWYDPLQLKSGLSRQQLDKLRRGWDLILDIDSKFVEYSKVAAEVIIDALKFNGIESISVKFSGGSGFHIGIPFEAFPEEINKKETRILFPEIPRAVIEYIKYLSKPYISERILNINSLEEISKSTKIPKKELQEKGQFNPFRLVDIDPQLISSRHMIRMPLSINEKTGLVSVPVKVDQIKNFQLANAKMANIENPERFLDKENIEPMEAKQLFIQSMDFIKKREGLITRPTEINKNNEYKIPEIAVQEKLFPQCISKLLMGIQQDGRKRAVFILVSFLQNMGWKHDEIQKRLLDWNKKNFEPLREGYIISQVSWFKKHNEKILPPNCDNESYYKSMAVHCSNCKCKNPVNYVKIKLSELNKQTKSKKRNSRFH